MHYSINEHGEDALLIRGGRVIDPSQGISREMDVLCQRGRIKAIEEPGALAAENDAEVLDASGLIVTPGLVDIHTHLREPGFEWKETVLTGSRAAVAGGFTTICCMPNTKPVNDNAQVTKYILEKAAEAGICEVLPIGAISVGQKGEGLAPLMELAEAGCIAFSDDGHPVANPALMRAALEYGSMTGRVLTVHEEEKALSDGFSMNESPLSIAMGLRGMPGAAEDIMISRDIELSRLTGQRVHFCHVSTARAVTLIRRAKEDGIPVTAEATPHNLTLTEEEVRNYNTLAKMSMPLRTEADREALREGLAAGVIDCVASDHAPHEMDSKRVEFSRASFGILGFQTTLPLVLKLVAQGVLTMERAIEAMTISPSRCFGMESGTLKVGSRANLTIIDPESEYSLEKSMILSKSRNTPFLGEKFKGIAAYTIFNGKIVSVNGGENFALSWLK